MRNGLNTALNRGDKKSKLDAGGSSGKTVVGGSSSFLNNEKPEDKYLQSLLDEENKDYKNIELD